MENKIKKAFFIIRNMDSNLRKNLQTDKGYIHEEKLWENTYIRHQADRRKEGGHFSVEMHIRGMVYAMFGSKIPWKSIKHDIDTKTGIMHPVDDIFHNYNTEFLLKCDTDELADALKEIGCKGKSVRVLVDALIKYNIPKLLEFEEKYGSIDDHYKVFADKDPSMRALLRTLSGSKSANKMQKIGASLAAEYLRNVGYDIAKTARSIRRIIGSECLVFSSRETASLSETYDIIAQIAKRAKRSVNEINNILELYCDKNFGFCGIKPDCKNCGVKKYCVYPNSEKNIQKKKEKADEDLSKEKHTDKVNTAIEKNIINNVETVQPPVVEEYGELVLKEKIARERRKSAEKRTRVLGNETKEELRNKDLRKFASPRSLTDIRTSDVFVTRLIERYSILQDKYADDFPLGLVDISRDEFKTLQLRVRKYIVEKSAVTILSGYIASLFLVKAVENYGIKGNFWESVAALLDLPESEITDFLKKALLAFCSSERLYFHYYRGIRSYTGTVLIHSVIGFDELDTSLNFIRDYYIEEMKETYSKDTADEYISRFIEILSADVQGDESEEHGMSGIYKVSFNLKNACLVFPQAMGDILNCLLFNIHAYYHRLSDTSYSPAAFYKYFKRWCISDIHQKRTGYSSASKTHNVTRNKNTEKQVEKLSENKKCSFFIDEDKDLFLFIPQFEVPSESAYSRITTHLYNGFEPISKFDTDNEVFGIFRFHTSEQTVRLGRFYKELNIRIEAENGEVIFDSRAQLMRKYLVFDSELTEISTKNVPDDRFYVLTEKGTDFFADDNYNSYPKSNYIVHSLDVGKDCDITVDSQMVFRNYDESGDVSVTVDRKYRDRNAKVFFNGGKYSVYTAMPEISIECAEENASDHIIDINEVHIGLDELNGNTIKPDEYTNSRFITVVLRKKGSLRHLYEYNIAVISGFEYTLDKEYYYKEQTAQLLDIYADDISFDIQDYPYTFSVTRSRELTVNADDNGNQMTFEIKLPVIYWEINEKYNSITGSEYVPSSEIKDIRSFTLDLPVNNVSIIATNEVMVRPLSYLNHKVDISDFHNSVSEYTTFGISHHTIGQLKLFEVIYTSSLREVSVVCNMNSLIISYISIGKCPLHIIVKDSADRPRLVKNYPACEDGNNTVTEDITELSEGFYKAEVYILKADKFGFSSTKKLIGTYDFVKGSPFALFLKANRNILKPEFCYFDGNDRKRVQNFYCEDICKPDEESEVYTGNAFYYNKKGDKVYLKDANPMRIELLEKNNRLLTFTITDRDNDGLLYEKARGYLVNDNAGLRDYNSYSLPDHYGIKLKGE